MRTLLPRVAIAAVVAYALLAAFIWGRVQPDDDTAKLARASRNSREPIG
jgi:hypothetical protein